jgi:ubiquinone/menaquinone biosynthesis C-methylase UbiE
MSETMFDATGEPSTAILARYNRIAPVYDRLHGRWLRLAGGEAQSAFEAAALALLNPGMSVLDVGCGTGAFARRLLRQADTGIDLVLLDACREMLNRTQDIPARRVFGNLERMPFADGSFDLVTCAWALETTTRTASAVAELVRVTKPGGHVCLVFCSAVARPGLAGRLMQATVGLRNTGRFLKLADVEAALSACDIGALRRLPCNGPAVALLITRQERRQPALPLPTPGERQPSGRPY